MPAEAIHLSAFHDSFQKILSFQTSLSTKDFIKGARVGAVFVDLPYFDRFPSLVLRYVLKKPVIEGSPWGDSFHQKRPVSIGKALLQSVLSLRAVQKTREESELLLAFTLGYLSHLAVDTAIHPSVNRLAKERATRLNDSVMRQHSEVEKFQSILFHEQRMGFDFMGRKELIAHIEIDKSLLLSMPIVSSHIQNAIETVLGTTPTKEDFARWTKGYKQYAYLLASFVGKRIAPQKEKDKMRPEVFDIVEDPFPERFLKSVTRSTRYLEAALHFLESPENEEDFDKVAPEGSIDDPPFPVE